jgi:uncharacterized protein YbjT (DUF2867 family)
MEVLKMTASHPTSGSILVTGATGVAGSAIVREFIRSGHPVRVLVRNPARAAALRAFPTVEVMEGDLLKPETLRSALTGVHRALLLSSPDAQLVQAQTSFIDAAASSGVKHIVKFSGLSAADIGTPFIFGPMHAEIEAYLQDSGLMWTHLQPSQFMTEYLRELPTILAQGALFLPFRDARLVPVDLADIARAAFLLLTTSGHEGKTYAISGPEALSMDEIAQKITVAIGRTIRYVDVPRETRNAALLAAGVPEFFVDALDAQTGERLLGRESTVHLETHQALGLKPTSFSEFAARNASAFLGETTYPGLA